jgi:hypothetical protein
MTDKQVSPDRGIRWLTAAAVLVVACIAAVVSFIHIEHLAATNGQDALTAILLPISVDGTVAVASLAMLWAARANVVPAPRLARVMLVLGVTATLAANADYGAAHGLTGELLSGWPAIAFIGSVEIALSMVRRTRVPVAVVAAVPAAVTVPELVPVPEAVPVSEVLPVPAPERRPVPAKRVPAPGQREYAETHYAADLASGRVPGVLRIRTDLKVGQPRAQELRDHLASVLAGSTQQLQSVEA